MKKLLRTASEREGNEADVTSYYFWKTTFSFLDLVLRMIHSSVRPVIHLLYYCRPVFLNRRAAARYRALASIIPGRENLSF
jgi:hypothetical protein